MKYLHNLKTSERISLSFSVTYFFIWYSDQKEQSFSKMNENYLSYKSSDASQKDIEDFRWYLLMQDTIIIPENGNLICSPGVERKIKEDPELIRDKHLYRADDKIYFIYSQYFDNIGEVKVLFDTTPYITSQLIIIKIWIIFIFLVFILQFFWWRYISRKLLSDLINISKSVEHIDINTRQSRINCSNMPEWDEIRILSEALNTSYDDIELQTSKLKQFLTDVSHEFKTPLMVLNSKLDLLEKKKNKNLLEQSDIDAYFDLSRQNIAKLNGLLRSLFFVSRIEEQTWCIVTLPLKVHDFIEGKLLQISESFPHKTLSYNLDIPKDLEYKVEENTFSILLDNLISNAMKFSPENMHIDIIWKKNYFSVRDNGPWIPEEEREKIWEKFYRRDTKLEWFGVGLYLVKRIISIYGWDIHILSHKKKWTTFKVDISNNI